MLATSFYEHGFLMSSQSALAESMPLRFKLHNREPLAGPSERYGMTALSVRGACARPAATNTFASSCDPT